MQGILVKIETGPNRSKVYFHFLAITVIYFCPSTPPPPCLCLVQRSARKLPEIQAIACMEIHI